MGDNYKSGAGSTYAVILLARHASRVTSEKSIWSACHAIFSPPKRLRDESKWEAYLKRDKTYNSHPSGAVSENDRTQESVITFTCFSEAKACDNIVTPGGVIFFDIRIPSL